MSDIYLYDDLENQGSIGIRCKGEEIIEFTYEEAIEKGLSRTDVYELCILELVERIDDLENAAWDVSDL